MNKRTRVRRTLRDIDRFEHPNKIYQRIIDGEPWHYKTKPDYYHTRDKALCALTYLSNGRISEVCKVKKSQFDFESDPDFVLIRDFEIGKRKKHTIMAEGVPKKDIPLPRAGVLEKFTKLLLDYYNICEEDYLFPFGRVRAWEIINHLTGLWPHWFRSQGFSDAINRQDIDVFAVARMYGVDDPTTLAHYDKGVWEDHKKKLSR